MIRNLLSELQSIPADSFLSSVCLMLKALERKVAVETEWNRDQDQRNVLLDHKVSSQESCSINSPNLCLNH